MLINFLAMSVCLRESDREYEWMNIRCGWRRSFYSWQPSEKLRAYFPKWSLSESSVIYVCYLLKDMRNCIPPSKIVFSSVQSLSCVWLFATPRIAARQASLSITNSWSSLISRSSSQWCHPAISSSVVPFSSCSQSLQHQSLFQWVNSSHEVAKYWSFSFSIIPSKEHPGLISFRMDWLDLLQSKGLSRVFSNTTVQKHQFFGTQLSSQSNSHIHTWPLEKP